MPLNSLHVVSSIEVDDRCADSMSWRSCRSKSTECASARKRVAPVLDDDQLELFFGMTGRVIINDVAPIGAQIWAVI